MSVFFNRLDPSLLSEEELDSLSAFAARRGHVVVVDEQGKQAELPDPLFRHLVRVAELMRDGRPVVMIPEDEALTTQAAASFLGCSRQHLVNLLESGALPFFRTGTHRRIVFRDLVEYARKRDRERRCTLDALSRAVDDAGLYESAYTGKE